MSPTAVLLVVFVICTAVCYLVAKKKNADTPFWVVMGIMLGPLAVPAVFFSKPKPIPRPAPVNRQSS